MERHLSGATIRHFGLGTALWSVALAALLEYWFVSLLLGVLAFGVGVGLGDWEGGDR